MNFKKIYLEYIWIDGENLRSKIKILDISNTHLKITVDLLPEWNFDGSSTGQAVGTDSDVLIKPHTIYLNPFVNWMESYLVLCDCYNKNETPHLTNTRVKIIETYNKCKDQEPLFGIEQEYIIFERENNGINNINLETVINDDDDTNNSIIYPIAPTNTDSDYIFTDNKIDNSVLKPYKWIKHDEPGNGKQGPYYCSVGGANAFGREISNKHLELCLKAGLNICGTNAEVMASQWEYQIGILNPIEMSDQLWISRYILHKISENYDCVISFHPKPYKGDWNGSGGHTNFSTKIMREQNGIKYIVEACEKLSYAHNEHMKVYGKYNEERLTGLYETSSMNSFSWGISDRGKSIRIPLNVAKEGCGYFEDRRPSANLDPYLVCEKIINTLCLS